MVTRELIGKKDLKNNYRILACTKALIGIAEIVALRQLKQITNTGALFLGAFTAWYCVRLILRTFPENGKIVPLEVF